MSPPLLLLATNNDHKVHELRALFADCGWRLVTPRELGIALDPEESGASYEANARIKAEAFARAGGQWALADDSGIEVDALDGGPGVQSARYGGADLPHERKIELLLAAIAATGNPLRAARFRAAFALAAPDGRVWSSEGVWPGQVAAAPRGGAGFGYDPIFAPEDAGGRTAAELTFAEKNRISHRARAAAALLPVLHALRVTTVDRNEPRLSHIDEAGRARMVDVSEKDDTHRVAVARGRVVMRAETLALIEGGGIAKGNVLTTAQIAGVMAAKRTHELIPMCHPLLLTGIDVTLTPDRGEHAVLIEARVRTTGKTGVEMEALTAVSVAALTVYDMCKAVDRAMRVEDVRLVEKRGGKSGDVLLE
jgi:cyclic pyranopterin monophosphate synthase